VQETDLEWREEKLTEEQARGHYSFDGRDLLVQLEELRGHMARVETELIAVAMQLSWLVMEIFDALVDLCMFAIRHIPAHPESAQDVLTAASLILEHPWEEHAYDAGPWV
jgi:hypothetical protein